MCLGGGGSRSPVYQSYNYQTQTPTPTLPVPEPPAPEPETKNPSGVPVDSKKDDLKTPGPTGHTGTFSGGTGSGTSGNINT